MQSLYLYNTIRLQQWNFCKIIRVKAICQRCTLYVLSARHRHNTDSTLTHKTFFNFIKLNGCLNRNMFFFQMFWCLFLIHSRANENFSNPRSESIHDLLQRNVAMPYTKYEEGTEKTKSKKVATFYWRYYITKTK